MHVTRVRVQRTGNRWGVTQSGLSELLAVYASWEDAIDYARPCRRQGGLDRGGRGPGRQAHPSAAVPHRRPRCGARARAALAPGISVAGAARFLACGRAHHAAHRHTQQQRATRGGHRAAREVPDDPAKRGAARKAIMQVRRRGCQHQGELGAVARQLLRSLRDIAIRYAWSHGACARSRAISSPSSARSLAHSRAVCDAPARVPGRERRYHPAAPALSVSSARSPPTTQPRAGVFQAAATRAPHASSRASRSDRPQTAPAITRRCQMARAASRSLRIRTP